MRRAYDGRIEIDSASASEVEDVHMSDADSSDESDDTRSQFTRHTLTNGYGHDRFGAVRSKRKFFRSSLVWDPLQRDLRNQMGSTINGGGHADALINDWSNS